MAKNHKGKKRTGKMRLTDFDLKQMDEKYLAARTQEQLMRLSARLLEDLKEARDRLNRTPGNSSMPPSSQAPWDRPGAQPDEADEDEAATGVEQVLEQGFELAPEVDVVQEQQGAIDKPDAVSESVSIQAPAHKRAPGRQPGAQGHGRTQHIEPTQHMAHRPACCASCGEGWKIQTPAIAYTAYDEIDLAQ